MTDELNPPVARRAAGIVPIVVVLGACAASLVALRAELVQVPYLNDEAMHEEMVRVALADLRAGRFPPATWFSPLNLGSPHFLHYQSLGAMLTALVAWPFGVARTFTVVTWLLVGAWPLCLYAAARVARLPKTAAVAAALVAPFVSSFTGVGYEQISYLWAGYGLWSQLVAMWLLPLAVALSWRAVDEWRFVGGAALAVAATAAAHFQTGYLAVLAIPLAVLARPSWRALRRAAGVAAGAFGLAAWAIVPLVAEGRWAAINQFLEQGAAGADENSYGARRVLAALLEGSVFDWHHLVVITPLVGIGLVVVVLRPGLAGLDAALGRYLALFFAAALVLFFGRPTLGALLDAVPGARNLFLRRFIVGVQLGGILLAGIGADTLARFIARLVAPERRGGARRGRAIAWRSLVAAASLAVLVPGYRFVFAGGAANAAFVAEQAHATIASAEIATLLDRIKAGGGGRTFAGGPSDFGASFRVGEVPVYEYLASSDIDEVGFTLRTASLMSDPEVDFDPANAADYTLFDVRWLLLPRTMSSPVPAVLVAARGPYTLWERTASAITVVDARGSIEANAADLASFAGPLLSSLPSRDPVLPLVAYDGARVPAGTLSPGADAPGPPGRASRVVADLAAGTARARVVLARRGLVVLSASYDPGWQVLVDGRSARTVMVAPALVGVIVPAGIHTVRFRYAGFPDYPQLGGLAAATAGVLAAAALVARRRRLTASPPLKG